MLFYTGYYAASAPGLVLTWRLAPGSGDYRVDDSRRHDREWRVEPGLTFDGPGPSGDKRDDDAWLTAEHAQHYVFLGYGPFKQMQGMLGIRDPALPEAIVETVGRAGPVA